MKKTLSVFLSLCIAITAFVFSTMYSVASGNKITDTEITWSYDETSKTLTFAGKGTIPNYDTYKDDNGQLALAYPWKSLEYTSIVFGDEITEVGNYAFCYSEKLESVVFPDTITKLGQGLFLNCSALKSVKISDSITVIPASIFANCSSLNSIKLSETTTTIESRAFYRCSLLTEISFPESLTSIGSETFSQCTGISSIVIPKATTSIGDYAFYSCEDLTSLDLGGATEIGSYAFNGCSELTKVVFPDGTTEIASNVFGSCSKLSDVTLPDSVTAISDSAFSYCNALKAITIPYYVKTIGTKAVGYGRFNAVVAGFIITGYENTAAQTYAAENGLTFNSLGIYTEGKCGESATWSFNEETKVLTIGGTGEMDNYTAESLPFYARFDYTSVEIPEGITAIGAYAFTSPDVTEISVPLSVKSIGAKAIGYKLETKTTDVTDEETGIVTPETTTDYVLVDGFEITGYPDTAVETYAVENSIKFNAIQPFTVSENAAMYIKNDSTIYLYATDLSTETFLTDYMTFSKQCTTSFDKVTDDSIIATGSTLTLTRTDKTNEDSTPITKTYTIIVMGDVNGDGRINSADALAILQHSVATVVLTDSNLKAADIDNSSEVNSADALIVLQLTVGNETIRNIYDKITAVTE